MVTIHDMSSFLFDGQVRSAREPAALPLPTRTFRADRVIAVSTATRRDVENFLGIRPDRIRLVYSAPDPNFLNYRPEPARGNDFCERFQIQYPYILYAGRIRPHKNIPRLD